MNEAYKEKAQLLLQIMPIVMDEQCFALHGGSAINLFVMDLPRLSVDADITYIPLEDRATSLAHINEALLRINDKVKRQLNGVHVIPRLDICKLTCEYHGTQVKIEVNQTKRGIIGGDPTIMPLCPKAQEMFEMEVEARIVPPTLLYGGKIVAALSRQHPRDLFDCKYMDVKSFEEIKDGFMLNLLGGEKPTIELLQPNEIEQRDALESQFEGMTEIPFTYDDFLLSRRNLIDWVNGSLTEMDKEFLFSFEQGEPDWGKCCAGDLSLYPSVKWKLLNLNKLKTTNPQKLQREADRLREALGVG